MGIVAWHRAKPADLEFLERFQKELGYRFVTAWPIYERVRGSGRIMFFMIHASDHPQAPVLMNRAYRNVVEPLETVEQLTLEYDQPDSRQ